VIEPAPPAADRVVDGEVVDAQVVDRTFVDRDGEVMGERPVGSTRDARRAG
jgi:hypothetical protein